MKRFVIVPLLSLLCTFQPQQQQHVSAFTSMIPHATRTTTRSPLFLSPSIITRTRHASSSSDTALTDSTTEANPKKDTWKPKISSLKDRRHLRAQKHSTETIGSIGFHHIEFYCGDAKATALRFSLALGMPIVCESGQFTGNDQCVSYGLESGNVRFVVTAPYSEEVQKMNIGGGGNEEEFDAPDPLPGFDAGKAHSFFRRHGLAARAVGIEVKDVKKAFEEAVSRGATPVLEPTAISPCKSLAKTLSDDSELGKCDMAEVELYGDVVLRFLSFPNNSQQTSSSPYFSSILPNMAPITKPKLKSTYGLKRIDHAVGNVPDLLETLTKVAGYTGFHEFAEFTSEDVGTVDSGLNSVVLASDSEDVLLPLNEPTEGRRKSQIQTYLEQNEGPGLQHIAIKTDDIFDTITKMRHAEEELGMGFELMAKPSDGYYRELPDRLGDQLTEEQYQKLEELGILADADDEGVLLQIFTKPIGDRPTLFIEIIQRIGCLYNPEEEEDAVAAGEEESNGAKQRMLERPGCGGFGQGNFRELFKSIEDLEKTLKV